MKTVAIKEHKKTKIIAHRGLSGIEPENTNFSFVAAGNRSYFGIETDVHVTADGKFILHHDDDTQRMCGESLIIEQTDYDTLRNLRIKPKYGDARKDIVLPNLEDYINICRNYDKVSVLELKNSMSKENIYEICEKIEEKEYFESTIFISFCFDNLVYIREKYENANIQFLTFEFADDLIEKLTIYKMDLDIYYKALDKQRVKECHEAGIKVNCWTCDDIDDANALIDMGVDFITTNILE